MCKSTRTDEHANTCTRADVHAQARRHTQPHTRTSSHVHTNTPACVHVNIACKCSPPRPRAMLTPAARTSACRTQMCSSHAHSCRCFGLAQYCARAL